MNVIYLITCTNCNGQYVGSAVDCKKRFRIHKSDINTKIYRYGVARPFANKCRDPQNSPAFWSNLCKIEVMVTSLIEMLELPNFGHMIISTI